VVRSASRNDLENAAVTLDRVTVLREAGLVVSARQANRVVHRRTPLGRRLVRTAVRVG